MRRNTTQANIMLTSRRLSRLSTRRFLTMAPKVSLYPWAPTPPPKRRPSDRHLARAELVPVPAVPGPVLAVSELSSLFRAVGKGVKAIGFGYFEDTKSPILVASLGGLCISIIGILVPPTMFWSEFEIGSIAEPGKDLPHIWPQVRNANVDEANETTVSGR